jgi:translation initiation factor 1
MKKPQNKDGIVYSTDPAFKPGDEENIVETPVPSKQVIKIRLDTRHRAGKAVTLIEGFIGKQEDLEELGKKLRSICGSGGSAKDGEIIIQGDQREKVMNWLIKNGYRNSKRI